MGADKSGAMLCALVVCSLALPARAEPQPPGLNWVRLPGAQACISAASLAERVESRVGRVLFAAVGEAGLFVDGHVAPSADGGWNVALELSDRAGKVLGRRTMGFPPGPCSTIDEAVALVIAVTLYPNTSLLESGIALDPETAASLQALFGAEPTDPDPSQLPAGPTTPATAREHEHEHERDDRATVRNATRSGAPATESAAWTVTVAAAGTAAYGQLPGVAPGLVAHVALTPPEGWPIEAGMVLLPARSETPSGTNGRVRFDLLAAALALCPWRPADWEPLAICAGAELGRLHVESDGFAEGDLDTVDALASVTGSARLLARLGGVFGLRAALVLAVPLTQRRYTAQTDTGDSATAFRIPQLAVRAELGLAASF